MRIWQISREYAGIAEAGGVKNVTTSICEELTREGYDVTFFMPLYKCTCFDLLQGYEKDIFPKTKIEVCGKMYEVGFDKAVCNGVKIVFITNAAFAQKRGVYTYTIEDEKENPVHTHGTGFKDALLLNSLFQKGVLEFGKNEGVSIPDIIHCQDATTALIPAFIDAFYKEHYKNTKCVVTIHNAGAGYHHNYESIEEAKDYTLLSDEVLKKAVVNGAVEPFLLSSKRSILTTVSPSYAKELLNPHNEATAGLSKAFSERKITIKGITNGIDYERYNPEKTEISLLPYPFSPETGRLFGKYNCRKLFLNKYADSERPVPAGIIRYGYIALGLASDVSEPVYVGFHGRLVRQKGLDILCGAADKILSSDSAVRFVFIGHGEEAIEKAIIARSEKYAGKCVYFKGYDRGLSRLCTAISDFVALPSNFEPCGLEDFIAQIYGTVPIAHATGGLNKIIDGQTGFLYAPNTVNKLVETLQNVIHIKQNNSEAFRNIIATAASYVHKNYSWETVCKDFYLPLYRRALCNR